MDQQEKVVVENGQIAAAPEVEKYAKSLAAIVDLAASVGIHDLKVLLRLDLFWTMESAARYKTGDISLFSTDFAIIPFARWCGVYLGCGGGDGRVGHAQIHPAGFIKPTTPFPHKILPPRSRKKALPAPLSVVA